MTLRRTAAAAILVLTQGCSSLQPISVVAITETNPETVYITQSTGAVVQLANPRVLGDSVVGKWSSGTGQDIALPLNDVQRVATRRLSSGRTIALVAGITMVTGATAYALFGGSSGDNNWSCDYNTPSLGGAGAPTCGPTS